MVFDHQGEHGSQYAAIRLIAAKIVCSGDPDAQRLTSKQSPSIPLGLLTTATGWRCALRLRPGGTLASLGVYSEDLRIPLGPFVAGLGNHTIVTTLCPGGKERMRRLMSVVASGRIDASVLVTHRFGLEAIEEAYDLFAHQRDGVLKVAITP